MADNNELELARARAKAKLRLRAQKTAQAPDTPDLLARGFDIAAGAARIGAASLASRGLQTADVIRGEPPRPDLVTAEDIKRAAVGRAPTFGEFLERGFQETPPVAPRAAGADPLFVTPPPPQVPLALRAAGHVGDVLVDPLLFTGAGPLKATSKVGKVLESVAKGGGSNRAVRKAGQAYYKSAFRTTDAAVKKLGKEPVSDIFLREGVSGSPSTWPKQAEDILRKRGEAIGGVEAEVRRVVGTDDVFSTRAMVRQGREEAEKFAKSSTVSKARTGKKLIKEYDELVKRKPTHTFDEVIAYKREQQAEAARLGQFKEPVPRQVHEGKLRLANSAGLAKKAESIVEGAAPQLLPTYKQANKEFGQLIASRGQLAKEAAKPSQWRPTFADVPFGGVGATAAYAAGLSAPWIIAAAATAKASRHPGVQTHMGLLMTRAGEKGLITPAVRGAVRKGLVERERERNPWITPTKKEDSKPTRPLRAGELFAGPTGFGRR